MAESPDDELSRLRARAYGVNADIADDRAALERLRILEAHVREEARRAVSAREAAVGAVTTATAPVPEMSASDAALRRTVAEPSEPERPDLCLADSSVSSSGPAVASPPAPVASAPMTSAPQRSAPGRARSRFGLLVAVAAVSAAVTAAIAVPLTMAATSSTPRPYAVLAPTGGLVEDDEFSLDGGAQRYEDFLGVRVSSGRLNAVGGDCLIIRYDSGSGSPGSGSPTGGSRGGCGAPGFGPVVDIAARELAGNIVDEEALQDAEGFRFALEDGEVRVYVSIAEPDTSES